MIWNKKWRFNPVSLIYIILLMMNYLMTEPLSVIVPSQQFHPSSFSSSFSQSIDLFDLTAGQFWVRMRDGLWVANVNTADDLWVLKRKQWWNRVVFQVVETVQCLERRFLFSVYRWWTRGRGGPGWKPWTDRILYHPTRPGFVQ